jgi:hypothetical protein
LKEVAVRIQRVNKEKKMLLVYLVRVVKGMFYNAEYAFGEMIVALTRCTHIDAADRRDYVNTLNEIIDAIRTERRRRTNTKCSCEIL